MPFIGAIRWFVLLRLVRGIFSKHFLLPKSAGLDIEERSAGLANRQFQCRGGALSLIAVAQHLLEPFDSHRLAAEVTNSFLQLTSVFPPLGFNERRIWPGEGIIGIHLRVFVLCLRRAGFKSPRFW